MKPKSTLRSFLLIAGSSLLTASSIHAASTWNAGTAVSTNSLWSTATNWSADTAPTDGADLIFDGAANPTNSNDIPLTNIGSLALNNAGWNITLGTVTLNNGITAAGNASVGGTIALGAPQSFSNTIGTLTVTGTVANGANLLTIGGAGNAAVSAVIGSGAGGLTKEGAGNLTLSGTNTYGGTTTLTSGILQGQVVGTSLTPTGPLGAGGLALNSGTLQLRASGTVNTTAESITFGNNTTVGGNTTIDVNRPGATSTTKTLALGTLSIGAHTLNITGGNSYVLRFGATTASGAASFNPTSAPLSLASLTLDNSVPTATTTTVTLGGTNAATAVTGAISDNAGDSTKKLAILKSGSGTLSLGGSSTYTGGTSISAGTLFISSDGNLGGVAGGLTFTGNASLNSTATFTTARQITVDSGVTATLIPTNTWTHSGKVTGAGGLAFNSLLGSGPHASLLTNTGNDFTGAITVDGNAGGQSCAATFNSLVDQVGAGNISIGSNSNGVSGGTSVVFNYGSGAIAPLTLNNRRIRLIGNGSNNNGTGATFANLSTTQAVTINTDLLAAGGNGKLTLSAAAGPTNVFAGLIANGSANVAGVIINKTGAGIWAFSGANTHTGSTLIAAGTLTINSISNPGLACPIGASSGISLSLTGGTLQYAPINSAGAAGHTTTRNFGIVANSTIDASGTGALVFNAPTDNIVSPDSSGVTFTSSSRTISGLASTAKLAAGMKFTGTGVAANSTIVSIDSATQVSLNNAVTTAGTNANGAFGYGARTLTLTGTNTDNNTIGGNLVDSAATGVAALSLSKSGVGTWLLTGTNTYTGVTSVFAGVLDAKDGTGLPTASTLQLRGSVFQSNGTFSRAVSTAAGAVNWSTSSGGFAARGGILILNLDGGTGSLTWNGSSFVSDTKNLIFGSNSADSLVDFQNTLNLGSGAVQTRTITVNDNPGSATDIARISGAITNTTVGMSLLKNGVGTLELTANNTYTGITTVSSGTLALIGGSQTSAITVATGASLAFTLGSSTTSTAALDLTNGTVKISGTPTLASYLLMTASSITGTPTLSASIPGYTLVKANGDTELRLNSTGAPSGYAAWQTANGTLGTRDQDHDNDGVDNGTEHFLGGDSITTGFTPLPSVVNSSGTLSVTWVKDTDYSGAYTTDFVIETSATLADPWASIVTSGTPNIPNTVHISGNNVTYTFPVGTKNFARLKVTGP